MDNNSRKLIESYKGRLAISERYYAQNHSGGRLSEQKKLTTAMCISNTAKFINEAFASTSGTQRSDLGNFKQFCLDITTITMPNLIINDIFMVKPMASYLGNITYMSFSAGETKGGITTGTLFQDPFSLGQMNEDRVNYSGQLVTDYFESGITTGTSKITWPQGVTKDTEFKFLDANGAAVSGIAVTDVAADGTLTFTGTGTNVRKVAYIYDNQTIPQDKLPTLKGHMENIRLEAKARRLTIRYSQFAAFQSKNDYNIDLESVMAQQAQSELQFEIDNEAILMVKNVADKIATDGTNPRYVEWTDAEPDTVSYSMKAEGFARAINKAAMGIYKVTGRFMPNWMLVSPDIMPILVFVPGFKAASSVNANGPYIAGEIQGMKVIVTPTLVEKAAILGILASDGVTATGLYAPYMPLVPTQLLGTPDGTLAQGFSTMYDMIILNDTLVAKIKVNDGTDYLKVEVVNSSEDSSATV